MQSVRTYFFVLLALVALSVSAQPAQAAPNPGKRVALVVGNGAYAHAPQIKNPTTDAQDLGAALTRLGFTVILSMDVGKYAFQRALQEFGEESEDADVALFFYAGQGIEYQGKNWLGPVDMKLTGPADIELQMEPLDSALKQLKRSSGIKIAIIDACRDNPFGITKSAVAHRGLARGLAPVVAGQGTLIVMSTSPNQVALDGEGRNSPFVTALLKHIERPDLEVFLMMQQVVSDVVELTHARQQPWVSTTLSTSFYFSRSVLQDSASSSQPAPSQPRADETADSVWKFIASTKEPEQLLAFVSTYPESHRVGEAKEKYAALLAAQKKLQDAAAAKPDKRVALVIGNSAYTHSRTLKNPGNDANQVAAALTRLGFDVRTELDLDKSGFDQVMPEFAATATSAEIALVYFSGHAIELEGAAYVMPVDAQPASRSHIRNQLKSVRDIVFDLETASGLKLVIVDGCRDNPLAANLFRALGIKRAANDAGARSISEVERQQLGELIVAYATMHGEVAHDGVEANSPFTAAFLKHVEREGITVNDLFRSVKEELVTATKGAQNATIESYGGRRSFVLSPTRELPIEILSPKLELLRGVIQIQQPRFELAGRIEDPSSVTQPFVNNRPNVLVNTEPVPLHGNGQFNTEVRLTAGKNQLKFAAVYRGSWREKIIEFTYDGDLNRFAAVGERYALVIGINNYEAWSPLDAPQADARAVAEVLRQDYGFRTEIEIKGQKHSLLLLDAKRDDIDNAMFVLRQRLTENDSLLIYYAGHGTLVPENQVAYWIPKDGDKDDDSKWLSAQTITERLKRMTARSVLVVSDSCFSGAMRNDPPDLSGYDEEIRRRVLLKLGNKKSRIFISSGGDEPVLDGGCGEHSIFACNFMKALKEIKRPIFSSGELYQDHLKYVGGKAQQQPLHKELSNSGHDGGEFIFARVEAQAAGRALEAQAAK
jgi:uncharacterized caspase-like protein